jgi:cyclophilin family peptidyl-prolyl cis-trans isomerase
MKKILTIAGLILAFVLAAFILMEGESTTDQARLDEINKKYHQHLVVFETNKGKITIELNAKKAPNTVVNFVNYVKQGFYDNTIFHRAIPGVIIQGGGFESNMIAKNVRGPILNESDNGLLNVKGSISMARKSHPNSATSQFFVNLRNNPKLDYTDNKAGYAVFGKVVEGLDILELAAQAETVNHGSHQNVPNEEFKILSAGILAPIKLKEVGDSEKTSVSTEKFQQGVHYVPLKQPLPLLNTDKVEVVAAFSYGCGHCYGIYPATQEWKSKQQSKIAFSYFSAVWNEAMRLYARTYYTAIALGVEEQMHLPLFEAIVIHQQKLSNKEELATFFASYGVPKEKFIEKFDDPETVKRVTQAEKLTKAFNLASVPEFIVAGKYRVDPMRAGGQKDMFEVIDFLVEKETAANQ